MRLTKIYTKVGDRGTTMLASGEMVEKDHPLIFAYGTVDELNAFVGLLRDDLSSTHSQTCADLCQLLLRVQNELFDVGGELATPANILDITKQQVVTQHNISRLENEIDQMNAKLSPLENFVLPGGCKANSLAHVCRTICRRAEREVIQARRSNSIRDDVMIYLNRLSDWFFVLSRELGRRFEVSETLWQQAGKNKRPPTD